MVFRCHHDRRMRLLVARRLTVGGNRADLIVLPRPQTSIPATVKRRPESSASVHPRLMAAVGSTKTVHRWLHPRRRSKTRCVYNSHPFGPPLSTVLHYTPIRSSLSAFFLEQSRIEFNTNLTFSAKYHLHSFRPRLMLFCMFLCFNNLAFTSILISIPFCGLPSNPRVLFVCVLVSCPSGFAHV